MILRNKNEAMDKNINLELWIYYIILGISVRMFTTKNPKSDGWIANIIGCIAICRRAICWMTICRMTICQQIICRRQFAKWWFADSTNLPKKWQNADSERHPASRPGESLGSPFGRKPLPVRLFSTVGHCGEHHFNVILMSFGKLSFGK